MAKGNVSKYNIKKIEPWYNSFPGLVAKNSNFTIIYEHETKRLNLKEGEKILFSDISIDVCKNIARTRYGIKSDQWANIK